VRFRLIGLGEVLWDLLPGGRQLGGAPANFAYHAAALGAEAQVISRVGHDALGRELLQRLDALGVPTGCIEVDPALPRARWRSRSRRTASRCFKSASTWRGTPSTANRPAGWP